MPQKTDPAGFTNNNINNNIINIEFPKDPINSKNSPQKKSNWLLKAIVGGLITLIVSMCVYFLQNRLEGKSNRKPMVSPVENQVERNK